MRLVSLTLFGLLFSLATAVFAQKGQLITDAGSIKVVTHVDSLDHPWGLVFLPLGDVLLTERAGHLRILHRADTSLSEPIGGLPDLFVKGQGGLLDVALDDDFATNRFVYLTYAEVDENDSDMSSAAYGRGVLSESGTELIGFEKLWTQLPKTSDGKHYGCRMVFDGQGHVYLTLGEHFRFEPAQDLGTTLGKVVRLNVDGSIPDDNPFVDDASAKPENYSYGNRNIQAAAMEGTTGKLWVAEMGPMGGDEFNHTVAGANYGWPTVSWGDDYDGTERARPDTRPEFADAAIVWTPTISPSGMQWYTGEMFPEYQNSMLIGGLTASGIVRVTIDGETAQEVERLPLVARVRDVAQAPDGAIWVITDADAGKLLELKAMAGS